jgi:hypothetical protein
MENGSKTGRRRQEFVDSTSLLGDPSALRGRAERDGYLFFRGLIPHDEVLVLRERMLAVVGAHGWLRKGQGRLGGEIDLEALNRVPDEEMREDIGVSVEAYHDVQKLEALHDLPHHPKLLALYRTLFDSEVLVHPRHIARMVTGHRCMVPTPPHQDYPLIQGTARTWTCWIPIGDCPRSMGGLTVLRGSHREGYIPVRESRGAGGIATQLCPSDTDWVETDYRVGDVLTFPCFTVHRALPATEKSLIRLSLDVRYQPAEDPVEEKSLLPHCALTWAEIYDGWQSGARKLYWRDLPLTMSGWDDRLRQPGRRIC